MKIGLILIGDELLEGSTQDRNMLYLGEKLRLLGLRLSSCKIINDDLEKISHALDEFTNHYDLTICSGGLGPTIDDCTKLAISSFLGEKPLDNPQARVMVEQHYQKRSLTWSPELNNYHMIPRGAHPIENPSGLAPGLYVKIKNAEILCAPGVPKEFKSMTSQFFKTHEKIKDLKERRFFTIRTSGIPEEQIFNKRCPNLWRALSEFGDVSSYPRYTGIDIVLSNIKISEKDLELKIEGLEEISPIKDHIWHLGNGSVHELAMNLLIRNKQTVSTAESCTGGLIAHQLTSISGSSEAFFGTVVSYDNSVKNAILNVELQSLQEHGAVSQEVALQMARGVKEKLKTDYAISTSGVAGPMGGSKDKPVGTVAIGIVGPYSEKAKIYQIPPHFDRDEMKQRFAKIALIGLYKQIKFDDARK